jgi:transcriptional regulator with XRE-family HTH domain
MIPYRLLTEYSLFTHRMPKTMKFSQVLKKERTIRGWSQAMLAQELGTTPNTISAWERDVSMPSPYFRTKLCALLGKNAAELNLVEEDLEPATLNQWKTEPSPIASEDITYPKQNIYPENSAILPSSREVQEAENTVTYPSFPRRKWFTGKRALFALACCLLAPSITVGLVLYVIPGLHAEKNPYGGQGVLILNNSLQGPHKQTNWQEGWNENHASCQFKNGAYYSSQPLEGYFHACLAQATNFTDFIFEVEMVLLQGDYGGLIFCAVNSVDSKYYHFRVYQDGTYMLKRYVSRADDDALLLHKGTAQSFARSYKQKNRLAVVTDKTHLQIFINGQALVMVNDAGYAYRQIGVFAGNDTHAPAEAAFSNAKVWSQDA